MAKHAAAENLFDRIVSHDFRKVEEFLALGDSILWRELIRYEFMIQSLKNPELVGEPLLLKLIAYDIKTISSFHLAALMGMEDIIMSLMEKDVPVDIRVISGSTALHMACFSGKMATVQLLIQVYKADVHAVDKYGWSALHYACAEGHESLVRHLIGLGMDVNARDQDGTTPAFRAHVNGHKAVVRCLLEHGSDDDILNIEDVSDTQTEAERIAALYAKVNKLPKKKDEKPLPNAPGQSDHTANGGVSKTKEALSNTFESGPGHLDRSVSEGGDAASSISSPQAGNYNTGPKPSTKKNLSALSRSRTMPSKYKSNPPPSAEKKESIRRLIRKELEISFGSEYEMPVGVGGGAGVGSSQGSTIWDEAELKDIGVKTLTGLMREEFEKYKAEKDQGPPSHQAPLTPTIRNKDDNDYEDLYASLRGLPKAPDFPPDVAGPPLPPNHPSKFPVTANKRNSINEVFGADMVTTAMTNKLNISDGSLTLNAEHATNPALTESFLVLAPLLGKQWKKLAHALPLGDTTGETDKRIKALEKQAPKSSLTDQALNCLTAWRVKKGRDATVDDLIIALRKCNMHSLIPEVEKATQEFTA